MNFVGSAAAKLKKLAALTLVLVMLVTAVPVLNSPVYAAGMGHIRPPHL